MNKNELRGTRWFYTVDPNELQGLEEYTEWLEALLTGPCTIWEENGKEFLIEIKKLVATVRGLRIVIHPNEHNPPHFHVESAEFTASFRIDDCTIMAGQISNHNYRLIKYWHKHAQKELKVAWSETRPTEQIILEKPNGNY